MHLSRLLFHIALLCAPVALFSTTWLYLYPVFHRGCAFPTPPATHAHAAAPFRLLALGDPQLEGDSSLPNPNARIFPSVEYLVPHLRNATTLGEGRSVFAGAAKGIVRDAGRWLEGKRKAIDLWGNDWYLAHIVRSMRWWTEPTHVSVLGDLLGSQWVTDGEFEKRGGRYWDIVMRGLERVPGRIFGVDEEVEVLVETVSVKQEKNMSRAVKEEDLEDMREEDKGEEVEKEVKDERVEDEVKDERVEDEGKGEGEDKREEGESKRQKDEEKQQSKPERKPSWGGTTEVLGRDKSWAKRVINIAGNHDIGYAGDIDRSRIERFEKAFGSVNWDIWFTLPQSNDSESSAEESSSTDPPPALRLVILNSMNIDTPAWSSDLQLETYSFMNHIITNSRDVTDKTHATILLTHIPLEKEPGVCVDSPLFNFFEGGHGVKEQNMLSDHASKILLESVFGMSPNKDAAGKGLGRRGIVINGHDHAGCDVLHWIRQVGVEDECQADSIKREEAYWPPIAVTLNESMPVPSADVDAIDVDEASVNETETTTMTSIGDETETITTTNNEDTDSEFTSETSTEPTAQTPEPDPLPKWKARRFPPLPYDVNAKNECTTVSRAPHIREITLRSMMGEFSGHAGFLSAWFDPSLGEKGEWVFEFSSCGLGVQHWWWGVHIIDLGLVVLLISAGVLRVVEGFREEDQLRKEGFKEKGKKVEVKQGEKFTNTTESLTDQKT